MGEPLAPQPPCPHNYASIGESYARFRSSIANALKRPTRPSTTQSQRRPVEHALSESVGHRSIPRLCLPNHHSQTPKRPTRRTRASPAASGMDAPCDLHSWDASPQASPQLHPELQLFVPDSPAWSESETEGEAHSSSVSNFASDSVLRRSLSLVSFSTPSTSSVSARRMSTEATGSRGLGSDLPLEHTPGSPRNDSNGVGMRHARSLKARRAKATTAESRACQPFKPESGASQGVLRVEGVCQVSRNLGLVEVEALGHEPHVVTHDVIDGDQMLVVASDGLWDVVATEDVGIAAAAAATPECVPLDSSVERCSWAGDLLSPMSTVVSFNDVASFSEQGDEVVTTAKGLLRAALSQGTKDNCAVIVVVLSEPNGLEDSDTFPSRRSVARHTTPGASLCALPLLTVAGSPPLAL
eukprot:Rhum_TRINITY_DN11916_c0_g1::Rhum_TRINITY_DN11916_c0_g1_i2::g.47958::m.47958